MDCCGNCVFYFAYKRVCRRYPPKSTLHYQVKIDPDWWCGEYKKIE